MSEAELDFSSDEADAEEEYDDDKVMAADIDHALTEMHAASTVSATASVAAASESANASTGILVIVETSAMTMEEGMHTIPLPLRPHSCSAVEKRPLRSSPLPLLVLNKPGSRNVIGGGVGRMTSPRPPPSAAYLIVLLAMRHHYASGRRSRPYSGAASKGYSLMGYPMWQRTSALKSVAWVAPLDEDAGDIRDTEMIREQEEETGRVFLSSLILRSSMRSLLGLNSVLPIQW